MLRKDVTRIQGFLRTRDNGILKKLLNPTLRNRNPDPAAISTLRNIGKSVGLDESEIHSATRHYTGAFNRFCSRIILLTIVSFILFVVVAGLANNEGMLDYFLPSNTTYLPGTRYASIKPKDFR